METLQPHQPLAQRTVDIMVYGVPRPKGNKSIGSNRTTGRAMLIERNDASVKMWHGLVAEAAKDAMAAQRALMFVKRPLHVSITFWFARPGGHFVVKTGAVKASAPSRPAVKPDLSKIIRATEDALTGVVFDDDARIVSLLASKEYAAPGTPPGAYIRVWEA